MASKDVTFWLTVSISILAVLFTLAVIAVAIFFQKLRKKIEGEISNINEPVAKMEVQSRRMQNKYHKSKRRNDNQEPEFYDAPPLRDGQKEALTMKTSRQQLKNDDDEIDGRFQGISTSELAPSEMSYIECIGCDESPQKMSTFQSTQVSSKGKKVARNSQKVKHHASPERWRSDDEDSYITCIGDDPSQRKVPENDKLRAMNMLPTPKNYESYVWCREAEPLHGATLPIHASSPTKKNFGPGFKGPSHGTQQKGSCVNHCQARSGGSSTNEPSHNGEEIYEEIEENVEFYENTGYTNEDSNEDLYGNQDIVEEEYRRRSIKNIGILSQGRTNWGRTTYQENTEEEIYENQEIVDREKRKRANHSGTYHVNSSSMATGHHVATAAMATGQTKVMRLKLGAGTSVSHEEHLDLYENYVMEDIYENC